MARPPVLYRPGEVSADQEWQRQDQEGIVVLPLVNLDEPVQVADCARCGSLAGHQLLLQLLQPGRRERRAFYAGEKTRQRIEVTGDGGSAMQNLVDALELGPREQGLHDQHAE